MKTFNDYASYYNAFYDDKDYKGEAQIISNLIHKYSKKKCERLLNMGCGTGRHDCELTQIGYQVHGIDMSGLMIEIANNRAKNDKASFEVADIRTYCPKVRYDAVISLFHVMSYQNSNMDFLSALSAANKALSNGGVFIFDCWYGPGVLTDRPSVRVKRVETEENIMIRNAQPVLHADRNVVDVHYDVMVINKEDMTAREINEVHSMRYFFLPEIEYMLEQSGFKLLACLDCNTLESTDYNSWTAYFIAVKCANFDEY